MYRTSTFRKVSWAEIRQVAKSEESCVVSTVSNPQAKAETGPKNACNSRPRSTSAELA